MYRINTINGDIHLPEGGVISPPYDGAEYLDYAAWVQAGGVPETFEGAEVPQSVTRFQAVAALELFGKLDDVEAFMAHPDTPKMSKLAWVNALTFERDSPTVAGMAAALGLTSAEIDGLFITASSIKA